MAVLPILEWTLVLHKRSKVNQSDSVQTHVTKPTLNKLSAQRKGEKEYHVWARRSQEWSFKKEKLEDGLIKKATFSFYLGNISLAFWDSQDSTFWFNSDLFPSPLYYSAPHKSSIVYFHRPFDSNLCSPDALGYGAICWHGRLVNLWGITPLKKRESALPSSYQLPIGPWLGLGLPGLPSPSLC